MALAFPCRRGRVGLNYATPDVDATTATGLALNALEDFSSNDARQKCALCESLCCTGSIGDHHGQVCSHRDRSAGKPRP